MRASNRELTCDSVRLDVLLFGHEESGEFRESASHVESCPSCQDRLSKMAGGDADWAEVRDVLQPDELDAADQRSTHQLRADTDRGASRFQSRRQFKLDFLAPPSHPEMLGRLGRYEIESVIGAGGMGIVLKGFDTELNRPVAIKVLAPHLAHSGAARQRFAREARAAAAVVHQHVVAIHNVESEHETPFLVMQYVHGRSLQDRVDQEGPLAAEEILRIGMQAAAGLAAAHAQGVIHRDVKPANILLEDGVERTLLTDFGLARAADDASLTHSGIVAGTPHYMSPEQADGQAADARSDLFSLGAVLYFMTTGHPPFRAEQAMAVLNRICRARHRPVWEINANIPDELADVIDRLLEKKPSRRFGTASDVQQALARVLTRIQQPQLWRAHRWLRRIKRRRWQFLAAASVGLAVTSYGLLAGWFRTVPSADRKSPATNYSPALRESDEYLANKLRSQQVEFFNELRAIDQSLKQLASSPDPETLLVQSMRDPWTKDLKAVDAQVTRLEKSWLVGPNDKFLPNSFQGENP